MINRFNGNVVPFASDATGSNRSVFGDTLQSDNIDDNLNSDFVLGWEIVGLNDNPTKQDFNAMGYTLGALISYLYQQGVAEWNNAQEYKINSYVVGSDGKLYKALTGTTITPNEGNDPTTDTTNWKNPLIDYALLQGDSTKVFRVANAVGNNDAINKSQLDSTVTILNNSIADATGASSTVAIDSEYISFFYGGF